MKRVMIVGNSGSGKSTLARILDAVTGLPVCHGDSVQWLENWSLRCAEERDAEFLKSVYDFG